MKYNEKGPFCSRESDQTCSFLTKRVRKYGISPNEGMGCSEEKISQRLKLYKDKTEMSDLEKHLCSRCLERLQKSRGVRCSTSVSAGPRWPDKRAGTFFMETSANLAHPFCLRQRLPLLETERLLVETSCKDRFNSEHNARTSDFTYSQCRNPDPFT